MPYFRRQSQRHSATWRVKRDTRVANPNSTASDARSRDATVRSPPLRLALRAAMSCASCVSLPLRSAKRPLHAYIHKPTDSLRLPRFRSAALIHSHTHARDFFLAQGHEIQRFHLPRTIPCACHAKRCPATQQVTPFPTPATRNARRVHESPCLSRESTRAAPPMATIPHTCHAKRALSNVKMHDSPHLPSESTAQRIRSPTPGARNARPRSSSRTHHPPFPTPATRNASPSIQRRRARCHDSPRLPRETSIHTHVATRSRHAELQRPIAMPKRTRREHAADVRERSRTLGAHAAKASQTLPRPQTPT